MVPAIFQSHPVQQLAGPGSCAVDALQLEWNLHVLACGERRYQLKALENKPHLLTAQASSFILRHCAKVVAVEDHLASRGSIKTCQQAEKRRLSAA